MSAWSLKGSSAGKRWEPLL